jgi:cell cycle checkpoint control protein RAD9A
VQEKLHTVVNVKDFKAVVSHASTLDSVLNAYYSSPGRPLQFSYRKDELYCQFTVMTAGEYRGGQPPTTTTTTPAIIRPPSAQPQSETFIRQSGNSRSMPPPARPDTRRNPRSLGRRESTSTSKSSDSQAQESDSLFVPMEEEDRQWDPPNLDDNEEMLGWDASENHVRVCNFIIVCARLTATDQLFSSWNTRHWEHVHIEC